MMHTVPNIRPIKSVDRFAMMSYTWHEVFSARQPFSSGGNFKMADSDVEINVDDVYDSMAADHGVEVQTIMQGQAPIAGQSDDLDFMVQEEVETTTDGDALTVELDPVDNVIIALQNTDNLQAGGHFEDQNGGLSLRTRKHASGLGDHLAGSSGGIIAGKKRKASSKGNRGSGTNARKKAKKSKKGVRFTNRQFTGALATASVAKEAKEANEVSFNPEKRPRKWKKRKIAVKTMDGDFSVSMWSTGTCG